jgi:hypothetical protein
MLSQSVSQPLLRLNSTLGSKNDLAKIRDNLSAIVLGGNHLWLGDEERTSTDTRDAEL